MAWYEDLHPCDYFGAQFADKLVAVGWLSPDRPFAKGEASPAVVEELLDLLQNPWQPALAAGRYPCGFCRYSGGPTSIRFSGKAADLGVCNLFVPGDGFLFVAPSLILHYIDAHEYAPPHQFCEAVLRCPPMKSVAYLQALLRNGPKELIVGKH